MIRFQRMSIHNKLAVALVGAALLAFTVAGVGLVLFGSLTLEHRAREIMEPYAQLVSVGAEAAVAFEDPERAREILTTLRVNPQILAAEIVLRDGRLLARYVSNSNASFRPHPLRPDGIYLTRNRAELIQSLQDGAHLHLDMSLDELNRQTQHVLLLFAAGVLVLLAAVTLGLRAALRRILHPVQALTTAANQISNGDLRVVLTGTDRVDELGVLSRAFESMAGQLGELIAGLGRQLRFVETLLQTIPMAIFYKDTEGRYLGCNEEFTKITGVTKEDITGKTVFELWPGELSETYHQQDLDLLKNPAVQVYDFKVSNCRGELLDVVYHKNVFLDENGRVAGVIGAFLDITERKRAEEDRREIDARYRRIVDTASEGICSLGADHMITFVNARMAEMLGYPGEEMIDRPLTDFMFEEDAPDHLNKMENRRQGFSENYERRFRRKDGAAVWTLTSATPIFDDEHYFQGSFAMFTDITERKLAEDELRRLKDELEKRVNERTAELAAKNADLEKINKIFVGRELRMVELKERIAELEGKTAGNIL